jgi:hypothetical protein
MSTSPPATTRMQNKKQQEQETCSSARRTSKTINNNNNNNTAPENGNAQVTALFITTQTLDGFEFEESKILICFFSLPRVSQKNSIGTPCLGEERRSEVDFVGEREAQTIKTY